MKVLRFKNESDVKKTLEEVINQSDNLECVVVLGLYNDGSQMLRTSNCSAMQKAFIHSFFSAWLVKWFQLDND